MQRLCLSSFLDVCRHFHFSTKGCNLKVLSMNRIESSLVYLSILLVFVLPAGAGATCRKYLPRADRHLPSLLFQSFVRKTRVHVGKDSFLIAAKLSDQLELTEPASSPFRWHRYVEYGQVRKDGLFQCYSQPIS